MAYLERSRDASLIGLTLFVLTACGDEALPGSPPCPPSAACGAEAQPGSADGGAMSAADGDDDERGTDTGDGDAPPPSDREVNGEDMPCAVREALQDHCTLCHASPPAFAAPMALTSRADFTRLRADGVPVYELVKQRINHADPALRMPPASQAPLHAQHLAALNAWLDSGAAPSDEQCGLEHGEHDAGVEPPVETDGLSCYKLLAHAPNSADGPYQVGMASDAYVNFSFKAPWPGAAYGIVLRPVIDNSQVLHHWLLFQVESGVSDGAVEGSSGAHPDGELVHGWAPGGKHVDLRELADVGYEFPAGSGFMLEMHYNSDQAGALDRSGVEVCVQREKPEHVAGVSWLGTDTIFFATNAQATCRPRAEEPIRILGVSPHMHLKGKHMKSIINRKDGSKTVLHDGPFSFHDQTWYPKDIMIMPGDTITTTCTWSGPSFFGKGTSDEMCYLFTTSYPKHALADGMPAGTRVHGAGSCLGL